MSGDCGVCLYFDGDSAQVFDEDWRLARKVHICSECRKEIATGSRYQIVKLFLEGGWETFKTCAICAEIRKAFSCDGEMFGGMFWEEMRDYAFPDMTTGCLNRLQTAAAKQELVRRWNDWKLSRGMA